MKSVFWEEYRGYLLVGEYLPREAYWRGYLSCKSGEFSEIIEGMLHGGMSYETTPYVILPECRTPGHPIDNKLRMIGFATCELDDVNVNPENEQEFSTWSGVWNRKAVFRHMKDVINTAEGLTRGRIED